MIGDVANQGVGETRRAAPSEPNDAPNILDGHGVETVPPPASPIAVNAATAGRLFGLSERTWWGLHSAGKVPTPLHLGGSTRWCLEELRSWAMSGCPGRQKWEQTWAAAQVGSK